MNPINVVINLQKLILIKKTSPLNTHIKNFAIKTGTRIKNQDLRLYEPAGGKAPKKCTEYSHVR